MNARVTILHDAVADAIDPHEPRDAPFGADTEARDSFDARVVTLEQPLMELTSSQRAAMGAAVRIDTSDAVWLGEVEACSATGDGFALRVHLRHVLRDFETLARLAERFGNPALKGMPVQI
jgi:hypothetical protein